MSRTPASNTVLPTAYGASSQMSELAAGEIMVPSLRSRSDIKGMVETDEDRKMPPQVIMQLGQPSIAQISKLDPNNESMLDSSPLGDRIKGYSSNEISQKHIQSSVTGEQPDSS